MGWFCCFKPDVRCEVEVPRPDAYKSGLTGRGKGEASGQLGLALGQYSSSSNADGSPMISASVSRTPTMLQSVFYECSESWRASISTDGEEEWYPALDVSRTSSISGPSSPCPAQPTGLRGCTPAQSSTQAADRHAVCEEAVRAESAASASEQPMGCLPMPGVPEPLAAIMSGYLQGSIDSCRVLAKTMGYMKDQQIGPQDLRAQLQSWLDQVAARPAAAESNSPAGQLQELDSMCERVEQLLQNVAALRFCADQCARVDDCKQVSFGPLALYYAHDKEAKKHFMKARCILNEPLTSIVCLAREVDLAITWNPALAQMEELVELSPNELLMYMALWAPWPIANPEVYLRAVGADLLDTEGALVIACTGLNELPRGVKRVTAPGRQLLHVDTGGFRFQPLPPDPATGEARTAVSVLMGLDGSRLHVPDIIISFVLKVFAPLVYSTCVRVLRKLFHAKSGSQLLQKLQERQELYGGLAARVEQHLARLALISASTAAAAGGGSAEP